MNLNYTYNTPEEIFKNIKFLKDFSIYEYTYLILFIFLYFLTILYILPYLYNLKESYIENKEKKKKKLLLKKIIMQKELEDEILKEIKKYN